MTTAIMRLTSEELVEFGNRWGMDEDSILEAFEDGTLKAYLNENDFITSYTEERGSITDIISSIAIAPELTMIMGSAEKAIIALSGGIQLESGVIVIPAVKQEAAVKEAY